MMTGAVTALTTIHAAIAWLTIAGAVGVTTLAGAVIDRLRRRMAPRGRGL